MPRSTAIDGQSFFQDGSIGLGLSELQRIEGSDELNEHSTWVLATQANGSTALELYDPNAGPELFEGVHQHQHDLLDVNRNQVYVDPLIGVNTHILEGYMAQSSNIQQLLKDQMVYYDMETTTQGTWPNSVDITTTYDENGNTIGKRWENDNGYSAFTNSEGETTYYDSNGNEITHDQYKEKSGSLWQRFWEWLTDHKGDSNITAETDIYLGNLIDTPGSLGYEMQSALDLRSDNRFVIEPINLFQGLGAGVMNYAEANGLNSSTVDVVNNLNSICGGCGRHGTPLQANV